VEAAVIEVGTRVELEDGRKGTVGPVPEGENEEQTYVLADDDLGQAEVQAYFVGVPEDTLTPL
jgi:hypothetical protein